MHFLFRHIEVHVRQIIALTRMRIPFLSDYCPVGSAPRTEMVDNFAFDCLPGCNDIGFSMVRTAAPAGCPTNLTADDPL